MLSALFSNAIHDNQCDAGQGQQQPRLPTTPTNFYLSIQFGFRFGIKKLAFSPSLNPHPLGFSVSIQQSCSMKRDEGNPSSPASERRPTTVVTPVLSPCGGHSVELISSRNYCDYSLLDKSMRLELESFKKKLKKIYTRQKSLEKLAALKLCRSVLERSARRCWKTWWCHHHHLIRTPLCRCHYPFE